MGEYVDFHGHVQMLSKFLEERNAEEQSFQIPEPEDTVERRKYLQRRRRIFDPHFYKVRPCICVAGCHRSAIQRVKSAVSGLSEEPLPLESFHVARPTDVKDGALLVPKVILVAVHCPGRKLIDSLGNEGQLDFLYDEVIEMGADILVIYLDLPKVIYPPANDCIYHPRVAELLFPSQPKVRDLSNHYGLITVTEGSDFNTRQKNFIRDWVTKPVAINHRIYRTAEYLSEYSEAEWWSESEARRGHVTTTTTGDELGRSFRGFVSANEQITVNRKKPKKQRRVYGTARASVELRRPLLPSRSEDTIALELFNGEFNHSSQSFASSEQV